MKIECDLETRPVQNPFLLYHIADPADADLLVQLCLLLVVQKCLNVWKESIREEGVRAIQNAKTSAKKADTVHYQEFLAECIRVQGKSEIYNSRKFKAIPLAIVGGYGINRT